MDSLPKTLLVPVPIVMNLKSAIPEQTSSASFLELPAFIPPAEVSSRPTPHSPATEEPRPESGHGESSTLQAVLNLHRTSASICNKASNLCISVCHSQ